MRRRVIISLVLIVALLAGGGGAAILLVRTAPTPPTSGEAQPALLVRGVTLNPQTVVEPIVGYGTARADRHAWITAEVSGEVVELKSDLRVGAAVEAGELLVRIDDRQYQRKLDRARSLLAVDEAQLRRLDIEEQNLDRLIEIATTELGIAEREYERVVGLFEAGQAPHREVDVARQDYERARRTLQTLENSKALLPQQRAAQLATRDLHQAEVGLAELEIERCRICAPFRGQLEAVEVEIGERVTVGRRLFALLDPDLIEVPIELPVSLRDRVLRGAACRLTLENNRAVAWSGQVARIAPSADQATRTFATFVEVDNTRQQPPLMPGQFVRAVIDGPTWEGVLIVPRGIILGSVGVGPAVRQHVYVCDDGVARRQPVSVERHLLDQAVVRGLEAGDVVITSNLDALFDGAPVRVQPDRTLAARDPNDPPGPTGRTDEENKPAEETTIETPADYDAASGS